MSPERTLVEITKTAARLKKLYTAAVYDIMDEMGLPHQCLDLAIKPIDRTMRIAGPAFTIATAADPRSDAEYTDFPEVSTFDFFKRMYPGCVVLVAAAGDQQSGHWGELMSTAAKARGAAGVVVDGGMRDGNLLFDIPDWPVFTRYMSPIEFEGARENPCDRKTDRGLRHHLAPPPVDSGDWVFGDIDGVVVIPSARVEDVLKKAEEIGGIEDEIRDQIRDGADLRKVFEKYGRL